MHVTAGAGEAEEYHKTFRRAAWAFREQERQLLERNWQWVGDSNWQ